MRTKEGGVMSIREMEEAGIPLPEVTEEEQETSYGKIRVVRQVPEANEGFYDPKTGKVESFHRGEQERSRRVA